MIDVSSGVNMDLTDRGGQRSRLNCVVSIASEYLRGSYMDNHIFFIFLSQDAQNSNVLSVTCNRYILIRR